MELSEIKEYIRVDYDDDDELLEELKGAAEEYLINAGIEVNYKSRLYKLAIKMLVIHWYENRETVLIGSLSKSIEYSLAAILKQLRYCGENYEAKR